MEHCRLSWADKAVSSNITTYHYHGFFSFSFDLFTVCNLSATVASTHGPLYVGVTITVPLYTVSFVLFAKNVMSGCVDLKYFIT